MPWLFKANKHEIANLSDYILYLVLAPDQTVQMKLELQARVDHKTQEAASGSAVHQHVVGPHASLTFTQEKSAELSCSFPPCVTFVINQVSVNATDAHQSKQARVRLQRTSEWCQLSARQPVSQQSRRLPCVCLCVLSSHTLTHIPASVSPCILSCVNVTFLGTMCTYVSCASACLGDPRGVCELFWRQCAATERRAAAHVTPFSRQWDRSKAKKKKNEETRKCRLDLLTGGRPGA